MAITAGSIGRMLDTLIGDLETAYPITYDYSLAVSEFLGKNLPMASGPTYACYPEGIDISWGSGSGGVVSSTNRPSTSNPLNFAVKENTTAECILLLKDNFINGVIDLTGSVWGSTYGKGLFIEQITLTLAETTEA